MENKKSFEEKLGISFGEFKKILLLVLGTRLVIFLIGFFSFRIIPKGKFYLNQPSTNDLFFRWDSGWYYGLVKTGYHYDLGSVSNTPFFPLYPFLTKCLSVLLGDIYISGLIISNISLFFACFYLYKLIRLDYDEKIAFNAILFLLIFPVSFFFSIFYTEGLFLLLTISCFYYARKKNWLVVGILGFLTSLTRTLGVLILIPVIMEYFGLSWNNIKPKLYSIKRDFCFFALIPAGLFSFMIYLFIKFNDPFIFSKASLSWGRKLVLFPYSLFNAIHYSLFEKLFFFGTVICTTLIIFYMVYSKLRLSYTFYSGIMFFMYLSSNTLESITRYVGVLFPIYISLAILSKKYKIGGYFVKIFSTILLILLTALFVNGYWIT